MHKTTSGGAQFSAGKIHHFGSYAIFILGAIFLAMTVSCLGTDKEAVASKSSEVAPVFPKDIPVYHPIKIKDVSANGGQASCVFNTTDDPNEIVHYYTGTLEAAGWVKLGRNDSISKLDMIFQNNQRILHLIIGIDPENELTLVTLLQVE